MIKDFNTVSLQLKELAGVINAFKSEAVQLRIIDLVIGGASLAAKLEIPPTNQVTAPPTPVTKARKRTRNAGKTKPVTSIARPNRPTAKGRPGGKVTLDTLITEGFFKAPKTIGQIVEHCDTSLAMKYKQSEFSGPLMRQVREKRLTRRKNSDGQYEYLG